MFLDRGTIGEEGSGREIKFLSNLEKVFVEKVFCGKCFKKYDIIP